MWDNYIGGQIRRCNRNLLIVNVILLACVFVYVFANARYLANFLSGVRDISASDLAALKDPGARFNFFVRVHGDKSVSTGIQSVEQTVEEGTNKVESTTVKANYRILVVGTRLLVIKANPSATGTIFAGALEPIPSDVYGEVVTPIIREDAQFQGAFVPAMLNASDYAEQGWWSVVIGLPILLLVGWNLWKYKRRATDYTSHPVYRRLRCFGSPETISEQIETTMRMTSPQGVGGASLFGPWLFKADYFDLKLFHLPDLVWLHEKVTRHSVNFIPTGKSYAACLYDRYSYSSEIQSSKPNVESLMALIIQQCPWAVRGFSNELKKLWQSNKTDFISAVDEKRREFTAAGKKEMPG